MKPVSKIAEAVRASTTLAVDSLAKQMKADGLDVVGFGTGEPDFNTPDNINMEKLWETDSFVDENTLTVNVGRLRKKLDAAGLEGFIATKFGVGYIVE